GRLQAQITALFKSQAEALLSGVSRIEFEAGYNPDSEELQYINGFRDTDGLLTVAGNPLNCPIFDASDDGLKRLAALFVVVDIDGTQSVCLQPFDRRHALTTDKFAIVRVGDAFQKLEQTGLVLDSRVAVILQGKRLLFRSFATANKLFDLSDY